MSNLPSQLTLFVGRVEEIAELHQLLATPDCRLLTVVGVGGIRKTRLALQAAGQMAEAFADGVYFVPLQPTVSIHFFISTVADAIGFTPAGPQELQAQLFTYLRKKELLLIIDNFEQLLDGVNLLIALLENAPRVKLLVTSREVLHLHEEWVYPIQGLPYPKASALPLEEGSILIQYSAVQLFVERARRVRRGFSLEAEAADVATICQMVEGMPLALELAAVWTQSLSCRTIADEIRRNLDFLATNWHNVPDRQRSIRAVFDYSCNLLTPTEQEVFKRMSVFRGGFLRRSAQEIAGASLTTLGSLVGRCLLRWDPAGRYQLHELLRQYAEELFRESPQAKTAIDERHCRYYSEFLYERLPDLIGKAQLEAIHAIEDEAENIRAAWQYAVQTKNIEAVGKAVQSFTLFYEYRGRHLEGVKLFEEAIEKLDIFESTDADLMLLAIRFQEVAWFYIRMGRFNEAQAMQERIQYCYEQLAIAPISGPATDPLLIASVLANIRGDYEASVRFGKEALHNTIIDPHLSNRQYTLYFLASATLAQGHYDLAKHYAQEAVATAQEIGDRWAMAYFLNELGNVSCVMGDYAAARNHFLESYAVRKGFEDPEGMAVALFFLGETSLRQGEYAEAQSTFEHSVALYRDINDRGGLARSLDGLGNTLCATGELEAARQHLSRALEIAGEINFVTLICTIITSIGDFLAQSSNPASGLALMAQMSHHPSSTTICKARARQLLAHYRAIVDSALYESVTSPEQVESVSTLAAMALTALTASDFKSNGVEFAGRSHSPQEAIPTALALPQPLIDPLTVREMEILNLIAGGLSNQEIATTLFITRGTVKWYTSQIYSKLGIESRTQAIGRARELSLIA